MEHTKDSPIMVVGDAVYELRKLANMVFFMAQIDGKETELNAEEVSDTMRIICELLERQIKALDGIQWRDKREKAVAA